MTVSYSSAQRQCFGESRLLNSGEAFHTVLRALVSTARTCAYTVCMTNGPKLSPSILRRAENTELSLGSLEAIASIRARLDVLETAAMLSAREKGATQEDIAEALGLTHQAIYYRFRNMKATTEIKPPLRLQRSPPRPA